MYSCRCTNVIVKHPIHNLFIFKFKKRRKKEKEKRSMGQTLKVKQPAHGLRCHFTCCKISLARAASATSVMFVMTKPCRKKTLLCLNKHMFVPTKHICCCDKSMLVVNFVVVATNMLYLWQLPSMIVKV